MARAINLRGLGGVLSEGAVYIGGRLYRGPWRLEASKWANPFRPGRDGTRKEVVAMYERYLHESGLIHQVHELRGKNLACRCAPERCHGDVLLRLSA